MCRQASRQHALWRTEARVAAPGGGNAKPERSSVDGASWQRWSSPEEREASPINRLPDANLSARGATATTTVP